MEVLARRATSTTSTQVHPRFDARLEEMLVATLLLNQPHNFGAQALQAPARAVPCYLSRAEAYMLERLQDPLTLGQVARACGVSTRTLQAAFNTAHGEGPMQWLREQRLHAVRSAILASEGFQPSITQIAFQFGFTHLGEFSQAYRRRFGETARSTLRRRH
jgi:transcriptional regulator GlxA family with amidase domain